MEKIRQCHHIVFTDTNYKYSDGRSVAIPIATEQYNTSRSQIVKLTSRSEIEEMEPEEIG